MYCILVKNQTTRPITLGEVATIEPGMGGTVARSPDIVDADRLVAFAGVGVLLDFPEGERERFDVFATEYGCVLDHPEFGRVEVTIFDPHAFELGLTEPANGESATSCS